MFKRKPLSYPSLNSVKLDGDKCCKKNDKKSNLQQCVENYEYE